MEREKIEELLKRYYDGFTTEEEETVLKEYLSKPDASSHFASDKALFALSGEKIPEPSTEFLGRLSELGSSKNEDHRHLRIARYLLSAAAGLALLVTSYFVLTDKRSSVMNDTYSDPELALAEVRSVLCTVSANMKTRTEPLKAFSIISTTGKSLNELGRINSTIDHSLSKLRNLNKLGDSSQQTDYNK